MTARPPESMESTRQWLHSNGIPFHDFANLCEGAKHNTVCPCDLLIDDYKLNIEEYLQNAKGSAILFSQPWNTDHTDLTTHLASKRLLVASNWDEAMHLIPQALEHSSRYP